LQEELLPNASRILTQISKPNKQVASNVPKSHWETRGYSIKFNPLGASYIAPDQQDIEEELEKFDLNDLVQYVSTRFGQGPSNEGTLEKGFRRVQ